MSERGETVGDTGYGVRPPGYRLPAATRLGPVRLQVTDLGRSVEYYTGVLGLRLLEEGSDAATLGSNEVAGTDPTGRTSGEALVELRERAGASPVRPRTRLGLFHFAILLPDRPSLARFVSHLAGLGVPAGAADHYVSEALYLQDPDGLGIEVYADRPRSTWRHRARELVMGTESLDWSGLAAAAGDEPWTGMPAGTRMGHVHLHVGGLEAASSFYHEGLGLDRVVWSYPGALFLSAGGYHHHLGLNTWAGPAPSPGEDEARLLEWTVVVPGAGDVADAVSSLDSAGYAVEPPVDVARTGNRSGARASDGSRRGAVVRDLWGTAVRLEPDS